jgi:hypothetical protein
MPSDGVLKSSGKIEGDHATHLWSWIKRPIAWSLVWKCSYAEMIQLKGDLWCECHLHMDGNKQDGKWPIVKCKALKWAKANSGPPKEHLDEFPWQMGWLWHQLHDYDDYK